MKYTLPVYINSLKISSYRKWLSLWIHKNKIFTKNFIVFWCFTPVVTFFRLWVWLFDSKGQDLFYRLVVTDELNRDLSSIFSLPHTHPECWRVVKDTFSVIFGFHFPQASHVTRTHHSSPVLSIMNPPYPYSLTNVLPSVCVCQDTRERCNWPRLQCKYSILILSGLYHRVHCRIIQSDLWGKPIPYLPFFSVVGGRKKGFNVLGKEIFRVLPLICHPRTPCVLWVYIETPLCPMFYRFGNLQCGLRKKVLPVKMWR